MVCTLSCPIKTWTSSSCSQDGCSQCIREVLHLCSWCTQQGTCYLLHNPQLQRSHITALCCQGLFPSSQTRTHQAHRPGGRRWGPGSFHLVCRIKPGSKEGFNRLDQQSRMSWSKVCKKIWSASEKKKRTKNKGRKSFESFNLRKVLERFGPVSWWDQRQSGKEAKQTCAKHRPSMLGMHVTPLDVWDLLILRQVGVSASLLRNHVLWYQNMKMESICFQDDKICTLDWQNNNIYCIYVWFMQHCSVS